MRKILNPRLAGEELTLRFTKDKRGRPVRVRGDGEGYFDVPDEDAEFLCSTPGWSPAVERKPRALPEADEAPPAPTLRQTVQAGPPKPKLAPPAPGTAKAPEPPAPPEPPSAPEDDDAGDVVAAEIEALVKKDDAREMRARFVEAGYEIPEFDDDMLLRDMKASLELALLADEEQDPEEKSEGTEEPTGSEG